MIKCTTRAEWIDRAVSDLEQGAAILRLEAQEWRDRAAKREPPRSREQMTGIAVTTEGMAKQMTDHCKALHDLLASELSATEGSAS